MTTTAPKRHGIRFFGRRIHMPQSRPVRIAMGVALCVFGVLGFLPVLGFWMIPLGVLILSYEFALVRRLRRRSIVWWEKRRREKAQAAAGRSDNA
jgi:purine-cytosine permease-like protein